VTNALPVRQISHHKTTEENKFVEKMHRKFRTEKLHVSKA